MISGNNPISKFITNKRINIDNINWTELNRSYSQDELTEWLREEILSGNIELPLRQLSLDDARQSFVSLVDYQCNDLKYSEMTTRYQYEFDDIGHGYYIDETNIGNVASDYFQQKNRFACDSINAPSPTRTWSNEKFLTGMLKSIWTLKCTSVNDNTFRTCLSLRKYVASQFKPTVAKSVYEKFNSVDVLDFSAGWGDRLCGFYSCKNTKSYIGIDPNKNVYSNYFEQVDLYKTIVPEKDTTFICSPAEDVCIAPESVDTVFTSPPYFNVEKYSDDNTQSFKRYKKLEDWLNCFLFKAVEMSYIALKKGGHMIINISDVYSGHKINNICDPMNHFIESLGMKYCGVVGMKMAKRPNSKTFRGGVFVEPVWVWKK